MVMMEQQIRTNITTGMKDSADWEYYKHRIELTLKTWMLEGLIQKIQIIY